MRQVISTESMVNVLKFQTLLHTFLSSNFVIYTVISYNTLWNGINVDPDQTAPDLGLHCLHMPFCQKLWILKF